MSVVLVILCEKDITCSVALVVVISLVALIVPLASAIIIPMASAIVPPAPAIILDAAIGLVAFVVLLDAAAVPITAVAVVQVAIPSATPVVLFTNVPRIPVIPRVVGLAPGGRCSLKASVLAAAMITLAFPDAFVVLAVNLVRAAATITLTIPAALIILALSNALVVLFTIISGRDFFFTFVLRHLVLGVARCKKQMHLKYNILYYK